MRAAVAPASTPPLQRSALTISAWNAVSRVTGFVRVLVVGAALGATYLANTYQSANLVSTVTFELLAAGLLSAPLVPSLVRLRARAPGDDQRLAESMLGVALVGLGAIALVLVLARHQVMQVLTLGVADPSVRAGQVRLGAFLLWFFLPQLVLYAAAAVATALLNARHRFAAAAFAPVANNVIVIATMVVFMVVDGGSPPGGPLSLAARVVLGVGTTAGVAAMAAVPLVAVARSGVRLRPRLDLRHPELRAVARLGFWGAVLLAGTQALVAVTVVLANAVPGGVVAYQIAFTFFLLPFALVAHPLFTALYPRLAASAAGERWEDFAASVAGGARATVAVVVPASALVAVLAGPIAGAVRLGALDDRGARLVGDALAAYALGIGGYALFHLLVRAWTAAGDARTPGLVSAGVAAGGAIAMAAGSTAARGSGKVVALGVGHSLAVTAGAGVLAVMLSRRLGRPLGLSVPVGRAAAVAAVVGGVAALVAAGVGGAGRAGALLDVVLGGTAGAAVWAATSWRHVRGWTADAGVAS